MITSTTPTEDGLTASRGTAMESLAAVDRPFNRVSWGAIFAGAFVALATQLVLVLLGLSAGLAALTPGQGEMPSGTAYGLGAALWWLISSIASLFFGGWIAGRLAGNLNGWVHGLVTWSAVTLLTMMLLTSAVGRILGGASGMARLASNPQQVIQQLPPDLQSQAQQTLQRGQQQLQESARQLQQAQQQPGQQPIERQAQQTAEKAASGAASGSFGAALALILGAVAAALGGKVGRRELPFRDTHDLPEKREEKASPVVPARS